MVREYGGRVIDPTADARMLEHLLTTIDQIALYNPKRIVRHIQQTPAIPGAPAASLTK